MYVDKFMLKINNFIFTSLLIHTVIEHHGRTAASHKYGSVATENVVTALQAQ